MVNATTTKMLSRFSLFYVVGFFFLVFWAGVGLKDMSLLIQHYSVFVTVNFDTYAPHVKTLQVMYLQDIKTSQ